VGAQREAENSVGSLDGRGRKAGVLPRAGKVPWERRKPCYVIRSEEKGSLQNKKTGKRRHSREKNVGAFSGWKKIGRGKIFHANSFKDKKQVGKKKRP